VQAIAEAVAETPPAAPVETFPLPGLRRLAFIATRPVLLLSFAVDIAAMVFAMPRALFPPPQRTSVAAARSVGSSRQ
jgi:hypothetical protein